MTNSVPPPDPTAYLEAQLMHALTVVNTRIARHVLRVLDAAAGQAEPVSVADELALADSVAAAADAIRTHAQQRQRRTEEDATATEEN